MVQFLVRSCVWKLCSHSAEAVSNFTMLEYYFGKAKAKERGIRSLPAYKDGIMYSNNEISIREHQQYSKKSFTSEPSSTHSRPKRCPCGGKEVSPIKSVGFPIQVLPIFSGLGYTCTPGQRKDPASSFSIKDWHFNVDSGNVVLIVFNSRLDCNAMAVIKETNSLEHRCNIELGRQWWVPWHVLCTHLIYSTTTVWLIFGCKDEGK